VKVTKHRATVQIGGATVTHDFDQPPSNDDVLKALGLHGLPMKRQPEVSVAQVEVEVEVTVGEALEGWLKENGLVVTKPFVEAEDEVQHIRVVSPGKLFDAHWAKLGGKNG